MSDAMREALTAAFDKHAAEETPDVPETPVAETSVPETPAAPAAPKTASAVAEIESTAAPEAKTPPVVTKDGVEKSPPAASATPIVQADKAQVSPTAIPAAKAPGSWSPEAKAAFAALPEAVKQDVLRREKEISTGLQHAAPARKHYEAFNEVTKPFQPLFDAYGVTDPLPVVRELLTARATLEIGSPEQKATFIANLIHEFGVPVDKVDDLLIKRGPVAPFQPARPAPRPDLRTDPALAPLFAMAEQVKQAQLAKAESAVEQVKNLPHFEDLREDIADVVEAFHAAGKSISLESAYKRALAMNPDLEPQSTVPQISKSQAAAILASRSAASSITGAPRTGAKATPTDRRAQLEAAWESAR
jgi:hypothetical protein